MAVVKKLGNGYYEIELSNNFVDLEVAAAVARAFGNTTSYPESLRNELPTKLTSNEPSRKRTRMSPDR